MIKIAVIKGDGIGPEIVVEAQKVLAALAAKTGLEFEYTDLLMRRACRYQTRLSRFAKSLMRFCLELSVD